MSCEIPCCAYLSFKPCSKTPLVAVIGCAHPPHLGVGLSYMLNACLGIALCTSTLSVWCSARVRTAPPGVSTYLHAMCTTAATSTAVPLVQPMCLVCASHWASCAAKCVQHLHFFMLNTNCTGWLQSSNHCAHMMMSLYLFQSLTWH